MKTIIARTLNLHIGSQEEFYQGGVNFFVFVFFLFRDLRSSIITRIGSNQSVYHCGKMFQTLQSTHFSEQRSKKKKSLNVF